MPTVIKRSTGDSKINKQKEISIFKRYQSGREGGI